MNDWPKGENWIAWADEKPRPNEIFVGLWNRTPHVVRYIVPASGIKPQVYLHGVGPIGIGPFVIPPDKWVRLPSF